MPRDRISSERVLSRCNLERQGTSEGMRVEFVPRHDLERPDQHSAGGNLESKGNGLASIGRLIRTEVPVGDPDLINSVATQSDQSDLSARLFTAHLPRSTPP